MSDHVVFRRIRGRLVPIKRRANKKQIKPPTRSEQIYKGTGVLAGTAGLTYGAQVAGRAADTLDIYSQMHKSGA